MKEFECKNMFYFSSLNKIGGVESFFYYLVKKYQNFDIVIFYMSGDQEQINRLKKYARVKKYNGETIKCEKAFLSYIPNIIDNIEAKEYIQILHTDYKEQKLNCFIHPKITKVIGVSQRVCDSFKEITGKDCELCYNPIALDKPKRVLNLISATRLTNEKGKGNMIKLGRLLDEAGIPYLWTVFTDDTNEIKNPNIVYMKPRLDITNYIANADYLVQLSKKGEGFGYSPVEALTLGTPVIVTPNEAFLEVGVKDGENGFVVDYDLKNVDVKKIYKSNLKGKFKYKEPEDNWNNLLAEGESQYQKDKKTIVKVKCIIEKYFDIELQRTFTKESEPYTMSKVRAEDLEGLGFVEMI